MLSRNPKILISVFMLFAAISLVWGCAGPTASSDIPMWMTHPPTASGYIYGVGTCGQTFYEGDARELALARGVREIYEQAHGLCNYSFEFEEEAEDGTISVRVVDNTGDETITTLSGVEIIDERLYGKDSSLPKGTVHVLVRLPESQVR